MGRGGAWRFAHARIDGTKRHLLRRHLAGSLTSVIDRSSGRCDDSRMVAWSDVRPFTVALMFVDLASLARGDDGRGISLDRRASLPLSLP